MELKLTRKDLKLECNSRIWNEVTYVDFRSKVQSLILMAGKGVFHSDTENNQRIVVFPPFEHEILKTPKIHYMLILESVEISGKNYITAGVEISTSEEEINSVNILPLDLLGKDDHVAITAFLKNKKTLRTDLSTQQRGFIDYLRSSRGLDFYTNSCSLTMRII